MGAGTSAAAEPGGEGGPAVSEPVVAEAVAAPEAVEEKTDEKKPDAVAGNADGDDTGEDGRDGGDGHADNGDEAAGAPAASGTSRRFPTVTQDTARPEGGGRAAPGDAPAPARQWPLLTVLGATGLGLLIVGLAPFDQSFRIGTILIGVALVTGAILRRIMPSVGMLAVRSRFTDMVTYGLLGVAIVLLSLMTQPKPWLEIPFLEDVVHSTVP
ncbi:DUF3017 domain-containing protein [Streptomyces sp. NP-1717]|uniref:DUF3017 domain-containing protein n=1 Tax=unclassified Streptomyces TaxID=2593676 RepID=UPI001F5CF4B6|nr:DUF3017 domain-containing protein [Streptomyces sp. NP-1717]MCI3227049.1 DUF3017 domain-containing protein [Streptomyces sp. NP-1717]WTA75335.1 DUF3017 domain-containing protein [Streptomyces sp. NBC_00838]